MEKLSLLLLLVIVLSCERNKPPTCSITQPSANAVFTKGEKIPVSVDADDTDGEVVEVRLYFNNIGLVTLESFPYNYEINSDDYTIGNYTIKATVTDNIGEAVSDEVLITIDADLPSVTTSAISAITASSAQCGGAVIDDGGATIIERGVCWDNTANPTTDDSRTTDGNGTGSFTSSINGLECGETYYIRAYATNSAGTDYGEQLDFKTDDCPTVVDYDGNIYQVVTIGDQVWMKENLRVTHYMKGIAIPQVPSSAAWDALGDTDKAYCWYDNSSSNGETYGALYNWAAVMNGAASSNAIPSGVQGVCPAGWHLPSDAEWTKLTDYLGGYLLAGGKLKETGTTHWASPNEGATNKSGFTALPGGQRGVSGTFAKIGDYGYWWSSTEGFQFAFYRSLVYSFDYVVSGSTLKKNGFSVRCVQD